MCVTYSSLLALLARHCFYIITPMHTPEAAALLPLVYASLIVYYSHVISHTGHVSHDIYNTIVIIASHHDI